MKTTIVQIVRHLRHVVVLGCVLGFTFDFTVRAAMPVVSNVRAMQRPGTKLVDIYYDVTGATNSVIQVSVAVSTNGGLSYTLPVASFTGPGYGASVVPGPHRQIVWDAGADWPGNFSANLSFRVIAGDFIVPPLMAYIPTGPFQMGDTFNDFPINWNYGINPEIPVHTVYVSAFSMDQFEVTKELWDEVHNWATNHGYQFEYEDDANSICLARAANHPITGVSWEGALKWCNARSEMEGQTPAYYTGPDQTVVFRTGGLDLQNNWVKWNAGYRLPTEAEWEKAARGGATGHRFPWTDTDTISHSQANYFACTNCYAFCTYDVSPTPAYHPEGWDGTPNTWPGTTPVGHFAPNGYGLYDMTGNVWEWCWDLTGSWGYASYGSAPENDPHGPSWGPINPAWQSRTIRGGGWSDNALYCRCAYRNGAEEDGGSFDGGFRCVLPEGRPVSKVTTVDTRDIPVTVAGRVRSAQTGLPVANAQVTLGSRSVMTGPDGSFNIPNVTLSAGNTLSIVSPGFSTVSQIAPVAAGSVQMNLPDTQLRPTMITNRPVVTDLVAAYDGIFISGVSFPNQFGVVVDWNGFSPNRVEFYLNSTNSPPLQTVAWSYGSATADIDMGQGFAGSYTPGANKLLAVAIDQQGHRSDPFTRDLVVIPPPQGLTLVPLEWDPLFDGFLYDPTIQRFSVELPPANLLGDFGMAMPLLNTLGLHLSGDYKMTYCIGTGAWDLGPDVSVLAPWMHRLQPPYLNWGMWGPGLTATVSAAGVAGDRTGFGLDLIHANLGLSKTEHILSIHFTDWIPGGAPVNDALDALGSVGLDVNSLQRIDINGLFKLDADLTWSCRNSSFTEAVLTPSGGVQAVYGPDLYAASLEADVTGWLSFPIRVTSPQAWAVSGEVSFGLSIYVWELVDDSWRWVLLSGDIASSGNWDSQPQVRLPMFSRDGTPIVLEGVLAKASSVGPRPIARSYLDAGPAQFLPAESQAPKPAMRSEVSMLDCFRQLSSAPVKGSISWIASAPLKMDGRGPTPQFDGPGGDINQVDLTVLQNTFPFSRPAIATHGPELMLLFVADNGSSNPVQFTEIKWTRWDGTNWSVAQPIRADPRAEFSPQVKYDGNGDAIAVWQRIADPNFTNVNLTAQAAQMEIVWSRWGSTSGAWSVPVALTANNHLDNTPLLCGPMANGDVLLVWTENEANLLLGTNGPGADTVRWCEWSATNRSWSAPQVLVDGLAYRLSQSLAGAGQTAVYAWSQDLDGALANDSDQEVFHTIYTNGSWSAPVQFTPTGVTNKNVRAVVSAVGDTYLLWESNLNLVMDRNFSGTNRLVRPGSQTAGFADYAVTLGPAGNLVLLWQGMSTNGSDAHYAVYDPVSATWSRDELLSQDPSLERSFAPVWDEVGNLTVAYNKVEILYTNQTVQLEGGGEITLTNVPQRGRVDLVVTKRALVKDLALEPGDFVAAGVNYLPGDPLTLTAVVRNPGNLAVSNVVVGFYDGDPDASGVLLTNVTFSGWFEAATTNVASVVWGVPEPARPHVLYAVVNRAGVTSEFDETNNVQSVSIGGTDLAAAFVACQAETNGAVRVLAQVHNLGAPAASNSVLAIRREGATGAPLATAAVPALGPGQLAQVALDLPAGTQPGGTAAYRLFADDTQVNPDVNPVNNTLAFTVNLTLDTDGDGLPDWYENQYSFLNATNPTDALLDYDHDGMNNLAEYLAGTNPDDPMSYLRINSISVGGTNGVVITWGSVTNKFYAVQRSSGLGSSPVFSSIAEHQFSTPPENNYLDLSATNGAAFFYRVCVE